MAAEERPQPGVERRAQRVGAASGAVRRDELEPEDVLRRRPPPDRVRPAGVVATIPPTVHRECVDGSGPTRSPWRAAAALTASRIVPGRTVTVRASTSSAVIPWRCRAASTTIPGPIALPAMLVPLPRIVSGTPAVEARWTTTSQVIDRRRRHDRRGQHPVVRRIGRVHRQRPGVGRHVATQVRPQPVDHVGEGVRGRPCGGGSGATGRSDGPPGGTDGVRVSYGIAVDRGCLREIVARATTSSLTRNPRHAGSHRRRHHRPPPHPRPGPGRRPPAAGPSADHRPARLRGRGLPRPPRVRGRRRSRTSTRSSTSTRWARSSTRPARPRARRGTRTGASRP